MTHETPSMKKDIKLITDKIKTKLKDNLVSIYLFGSAAKGSVTDKSDYDILVITNDTLINELEVGGEIKFSLLGRIAMPLDIIFQDINDLSFPSPLWYELNDGSRLLYGKDISKKIMAMSSHINPLFERGVKIGYQIS